MTRINTIDPKLLTDQHLVAELREISRPLNDVLAGKTTDGAPREYVLGKGHVVFFRGRLKYIERRFAALKREFNERGFTGFDYTLSAPPGSKDYVPTSAARRINVERILTRLGKTPRMYGIPITKQQYEEVVR